MKFVQVKDEVRWFEGRMCLRGKPVEVEDEYGLSSFKANPDFKEYKEIQYEEVKEEARKEGVLSEEKVKETSPPQVLDYDACPKCGRVVKRGRYLHIKHCKGTV